MLAENHKCPVPKKVYGDSVDIGKTELYDKTHTDNESVWMRNETTQTSKKYSKA